MLDCYIPPSSNFLAPVPTNHKNQITPDVVLDNLTVFARLTLEQMRRGEVAFNDVIRATGEFILYRRRVRVSLPFVVLNGNLIESPRVEALRSVGQQLCNIYN